jgi:hypothetical protein
VNIALRADEKPENEALAQDGYPCRRANASFCGLSVAKMR